MNAVVSFLFEVGLTLMICLLLTAYMRPRLRRVLVDLCGTDERAQFWTVFSNLLLIGLPTIFSLGYQPESKSAEELFFEIIAHLSANLGAYLVALVGVGIMVSFFALTAPKPAKAETE